ncbi:MAG TPA: 50S ribosomal protein L22 [Acholeplasma sp.]|nr:50S ribosomal protein L22 [Acholeplasma sp.]
MEAKAIAKTVRIAPRKVRLVIDLIRGKNVKEARAILMFTPRGASPVIAKVLNSAVANATHNLKLNEETLYVKEVWANESVTMKRMLPRAKGTGNIFKKRTSHITVVVAERE